MTSTGSLTLTEARQRRAVVHEVSHTVHLDLSGDEGYVATTTLSLRAEPGAATHLDLQGATAVEVTVNGQPREASYQDSRLHLTGLTGQDDVVVRAQLPYVTDGDGMHRFVDPVDGEVYLGCYGGMDVNRRVFACVDQPDIKGPWTITVTGRPGWTVLSNGVGTRAGHDWTFTTTPPLSSYLLTVCAGPWASRTWEHAGLPFGWHVRASKAEDLDRDLADLREVTERCFDYYAQRFTEPYPFDSYDQALVPGHNWGAMENPGCVTIRDEMLPDGVTEPGLRRVRAMLVAHEMAHMWFGDLVTFRWWEDTWLNESFADYLGFLVAGAVTGGESALAEFDLSRKAAGYAADLRPSTHPVAPLPEEVPDVDSAFSNFDQISYAKGNACLRQLAFWLGEETFFAGVDKHLTAGRFGTAALTDLVAALQSVTDRDLGAWVEVWLRESGHDTLHVERGDDGARLLRAGRRPHRVRVSGYDVLGDSVVRSWEQVVDLGDEPVDLPRADLILPNSTGDTFAVVQLDASSRDTAYTWLGRVPDLHPRVMLWATVLDEVARGDLEVAELTTLVERHLPEERSAITVQHVLGRTSGLIVGTGHPGEVPDLLARLAEVAGGVLGQGLGEAVDAAALRAVLGATHDTGLLRAWLSGGSPAGPLSPARRWDAVVRLARLGGSGEALLQKERKRDPSEQGRLALLTAHAARPDEAAKREVLAGLTAPDVGNREFLALATGLWDAEQRELVDPVVGDFLATAPAVAARGQAMGLVVGRGTPSFRWGVEQLDELETATRDVNLSPVLRRSWLDLLADQRRLR